MDAVTARLVDAITEAFRKAVAPVVEAVRQLRDATETEGGVRVIPITSQATRLAGKSSRRRSILFRNTGAVVVEWGFAQGLAFGQGITLNPGEIYVDNGAHPHKGTYYAIVSSTAGEIRVAEVSDGMDSG